ncbi:glycosyl hydrolase family 28-related protein [Jiangella alkaliphila]|uniref:Pectate lyase superfamily protein n=1 Tax=Jiangella alkaliphila TaxID=419479 RepID=A0A1H2IQL7_9ACTN|nr:glycosyl hydrolase family 28-related protein [Jiangella alkaliphila]SDU46352.1 Pectate lyase superfamily protein [Jiangella alkaliphila]
MSPNHPSDAPSLSRRSLLAITAGLAAAPLLPLAPARAAAAGWSESGVDPTVFGSTLTGLPADPTTVVLGSPGFTAHGDGVGDDTAALQAAVDEASRRGIANKLGDILGGARGFAHGDGGGVVLVPSGRYRLSAPIDVWDSVRIVGYGARRPVFVLGASTPGYATGTPRDLFSFRRRPFGGVLTYANNDTFGSGLVNLDIVVEPGNPNTFAVRFAGAQLCLLQDMDIHVGEGHTGIDHNANLIQRVRVFGGEIGFHAYAASAGWQTTLLDCRFEGQRGMNVRMFNDAKLVVVRSVFAGAPRAFESAVDQWQHLYVEDSHFQDVGDVAVVLNESSTIPGAADPLIRGSNQLTLLNCTAAGTRDLLLLAQTGERTRARTASSRIKELTYGLRVERALSSAESRTDGVHADVVGAAGTGWTKRILRTDVPDLPPVGEWTNVADVAASLGRTIGAGEDDLEVFQAAVDRYDTVYVPIGQYVLSDTLRLRPTSNLIGLHPRQTWFLAADGHPNFTDPDAPRALVETPLGGRNIVVGLGVDTAKQTPGAVNLLWQSGDGSYLADIATQFIKWHPDDITSGDPGYTYRGRHKYSIWVRGGGGTIANVWSINGWADNGLLVEDTDVPARVYEISVEHHEHREVVLRNVHGWRFLGLQTEDHIYGWRSQAVEITGSSGLLFANPVFFRVATVLGPYPYAVSVQDSSGIVLRGNRGYRNIEPQFTQWGAAVVDHGTGRKVPEIEFALIEIAG